MACFFQGTESGLLWSGHWPPSSFPTAVHKYIERQVYMFFCYVMPTAVRECLWTVNNLPINPHPHYSFGRLKMTHGQKLQFDLTLSNWTSCTQTTAGVAKLTRIRQYIWSFETTITTQCLPEITNKNTYSVKLHESYFSGILFHVQTWWHFLWCM